MHLEIEHADNAFNPGRRTTYPDRAAAEAAIFGPEGAPRPQPHNDEPGASSSASPRRSGGGDDGERRRSRSRSRSPVRGDRGDDDRREVLPTRDAE